LLLLFNQTDGSIEYGKEVFEMLDQKRRRQESRQRNARFNRVAKEKGYSDRDGGVQDIAEVILNNFLDLEGTLTGTAAFTQGVTGDFGMEIDGASATGRVAHTTGAGLFAAFLLEGKTLNFGSVEGFNQGASFSLGTGPAVRFSAQWGPHGFQLTSAIGVGVGADGTIISNGFTASIREEK